MPPISEFHPMQAKNAQTLVRHTHPIRSYMGQKREYFNAVSPPLTGPPAGQPDAPAVCRQKAISRKYLNRLCEAAGPEGGVRRRPPRVACQRAGNLAVRPGQTAGIPPRMASLAFAGRTARFRCAGKSAFFHDHRAGCRQGPFPAGSDWAVMVRTAQTAASHRLLWLPSWPQAAIKSRPRGARFCTLIPIRMSFWRKPSSSAAVGGR